MCPNRSLRQEQEGCNASVRGLRPGLAHGGMVGPLDQFVTSRYGGKADTIGNKDLQLDCYSLRCLRRSETVQERTYASACSVHGLDCRYQAGERRAH